MELKIKKLREGGRIPQRATDGSAGMDLYACIDKALTLAPQQLTVIPTGIAILSVVLSILYRAEAITPNYWVSSFFFVRDVDGLFVGIAFLFELFLFRHFIAKRYGKENVDELMSRPSVQFKKNLILCLIIAIYTAIFYLVPSDGRMYLRLDDHTLIFCLIPLLLFYKPAGKNRSNASNILYYALYILTFLIPTIVTLVMK